MCVCMPMCACVCVCVLDFSRRFTFSHSFQSVPTSKRDKPEEGLESRKKKKKKEEEEEKKRIEASKDRFNYVILIGVPFLFFFSFLLFSFLLPSGQFYLSLSLSLSPLFRVSCLSGY